MEAIGDRWVPGRRIGATPPAAAPIRVRDGTRDDWFPGIDLRSVTDAALEAASAAGCEHADVRVATTDLATESARDAVASGQRSARRRGIAVRVLHGGRWGFAASDRTGAHAAADLARRAVALARSSTALGGQQVVLAPEPVHVGWWASPAQIDPFDVPADERMAVLIGRSEDLLADRRVSHTEADSIVVRERVHYADLGGTFLQQQRIRVQAEWTAVHVGDHAMDSMRTLAPPTARGWEYVAGCVEPVGPAPGWDWDAELAALPQLLAEKSSAPGVDPGEYTLVLDPTHLWLTIHESVGHATELDRALGYEANYAGTTFATPDQRNRLAYGSPLMHITGDRLVPHGLATTAFDDEGVASQEWDIIAGGRLVDFQLDRAMAAEFGRDRSNGCAYADSYAHVPIQRMPNVSLQPDPGGGVLDDLIAEVPDGLLILGDNSWSIDMQRLNFQFTGQRCWRIRNGRVTGQVKDVAYQSSTPAFWHALNALGGPASTMLGGAINCGKGQPGQTAAVSHGCPAAVFGGIAVLNTEQEAGAG